MKNSLLSLVLDQIGFFGQVSAKVDVTHWTKWCRKFYVGMG